MLRRRVLFKPHKTMKPICRSKTFQKGEDLSCLIKFLRYHSSFDSIGNKEQPWLTDRPLKYKTIITITKVVEESENKIDEV